MDVNDKKIIYIILPEDTDESVIDRFKKVPIEKNEQIIFSLHGNSFMQYVVENGKYTSYENKYFYDTYKIKDEDYEDLLGVKRSDYDSINDEIDDLNRQIRDLEYEIDDLNDQVDELKNKKKMEKYVETF
jgi:polyhydroxyalkanoate synthesis regulator phasin